MSLVPHLEPGWLGCCSQEDDPGLETGTAAGADEGFPGWDTATGCQQRQHRRACPHLLIQVHTRSPPRLATCPDRQAPLWQHHCTMLTFMTTTAELNSKPAMAICMVTRWWFHFLRGGVLGASTTASLVTSACVRLRHSGRGQWWSSRMPYGHFGARPANRRMYNTCELPVYFHPLQSSSSQL